MIKFRQKVFGKSQKLIEAARENPILTTATAITPTAVGLANLELSLSRRKKDSELREEQTRAMEELTKAIEKSSDKEIKKKAAEVRAAFRKKSPDHLENSDVIVLPNPVSKVTKFKPKKK